MFDDIEENIIRYTFTMHRFPIHLTTYRHHIKKWTPYPIELPLPRREEIDTRHTLVIDLDDTIIFGNNDPIFIRPFLIPFLRIIREYYEIVIWTLGSHKRCHAIMNAIEDEGFRIDGKCVIPEAIRLSRVHVGDDGIKNLHRLGRELSKTIIIDDMTDHYLNYPRNGILPYSMSFESMNPFLLAVLRILLHMSRNENDALIELDMWRPLNYNRNESLIGKICTMRRECVTIPEYDSENET